MHAATSRLSMFAFSLILAACGGGGGGGGTVPISQDIVIGPGGDPVVPAVVALDPIIDINAVGVTYPLYQTVGRLEGTNTTAVYGSYTNNSPDPQDLNVRLDMVVDSDVISEDFNDQTSLVEYLPGVVAASKVGADGLNYDLIMIGDGFLDYARFGYWDRYDNDDTRISANEVIAAFYAGRETPVANMPAEGSATYTGIVSGIGIDPTGMAGAFAGDLTFNAYFSTGTVDGAIDNLIDESLAPIDVAASMNGVISENQFAGTIDVTNAAATTSIGSGVFDGRFFGTLYDEVAGKFSYENIDGSQGLGAFGASRTLAP